MLDLHRLGYKVTFDGSCDRYDGTSVSALTSARGFKALKRWARCKSSASRGSDDLRGLS